MFAECLQCGICVESCFLSQMGIKSFVEEFLSDEGQKHDRIWVCSNCWACQDKCPQKLPLMNYKWNLQSQCSPPEGLKEGIEYIRQQGYCLPIRENNVNDMRAYEQLEPIIFPSQEILQALFLNSGLNGRT